MGAISSRQRLRALIDLIWERAHTVGIVRYFFWLAFCAVCLALLPGRANAANGELPRAGAPRPLRLITPDGAPLAGLPRDVAWENRGGGVFFTLERNGTRNIWRAFPDPQDESRFPAWRALPVTDLRAPRYAAQPCPLPGDRALICVSNVLANASQSASQNAANVAQIVRFDLAKEQWTALSDNAHFYQSPRVSPDGTRVAFAGGQGVQTRVLTAPTNSGRRAAPAATLVAEKARQPVWLDNNALLIESLAPDARGLYRIALNQRAPQLVVGGGGEANVVGENGIVFSAKTAPDAPPNLYLVARDGSGLRVLSATENARRPATSPDGTTLAFDAPQNGARALWLLPLLRAQNDAVAQTKPALRRIADADDAAQYDAPSAQLSEARAASQGVAILGNLRGAANSVVTLEVGQGEKPRKWEKIEVNFPPTSPLLDLQGNRVLTFWNPPQNARGVWTLRLSLSGLGGGAQSLLRVRLPLPIDVLPPIPTPAQTESASVESALSSPLPRATPLPIPSISLVPPVPDDSESENADGDDLPTFPAIESPVPMPIAPIVVAPPTQTWPVVAPIKTPTTLQIPIVPIEPMRVPTLAKNSTETPDIVPVADDDDANYGDAPTAMGEPFSAQFNVAGTPARVEPGQKIKLTFWGWNRGTANWETGGEGANRVRLVARWIDFSTGTRRGWNFFWLRDAVSAGERTNWDFDLTAPSRPGQYKLIYGLVRWPASGEFRAPAYSAPQENWDGEFGAIAFAVEVAPKSR